MIAGVIGVGAMGLGVAASLCRAGITTIVRDVRAEAEQAAAAFGARAASSPADVAREADIVVVLVVDAREVDEVLFGDGGVTSGDVPDRIVVLSSTLDPDYVVDVGGRLADAGIALVDAPVSGGPQRAHDGALTIMVGGPAEARARCAPLFRAIAQRTFDVGGIGDGARMKLCNNLLAAVHLAAAAEALALAAGSGVDPTLAGAVINASSGASWIVADRMPRALRAELTPPRAAARILRKDVTLAAALARRCGVDVPFTLEARRAFDAIVAQGHAEDDDAVLLALALRRGPAAPARD